MKIGMLINIALVGFLLCLSLIMSVVWHGQSSIYYVQSIANWLSIHSQAASAMDEPPSQYFFFGRFTLVFYVVIFYHLSQYNLPRIVAQFSFGLLGIAMLGDIVSYWLSQYAGVWLRNIGFWIIELPALIFLILLWFGLSIYRWKKFKVKESALWILPVSIILVLAIQYIPHSLLLAILIILCINKRSHTLTLKYGTKKNQKLLF